MTPLVQIFSTAKYLPVDTPPVHGRPKGNLKLSNLDLAIEVTK